jgi:predicted aspartyl protease
MGGEAARSIGARGATATAVLFGMMLLVALAVGRPRPSAAADRVCVSSAAAQLAVKLPLGLPLVEVAIDGKPATLLLDTGAQATVLSAAAAARLGLAAGYESPQKLGALGSRLASRLAATRSFSAGGLDVARFFVMIGSVSLPDLGGVRPDGLLGTDFLANFAADLDFPNARMTLYRRQCAPAQPPWRPPFTTVAANRSPSGHLFFPVTLDNRRLYAFIDTGAQRSVIDRRAALTLGVTPAALDRGPQTRLRGAGAALVAAHLHRFARLRIGDVVVRGPVLAVTPLRLIDADLVLGEDFIGPRRIWFSYAAPPRIFVKSGE